MDLTELIIYRRADDINIVVAAAAAVETDTLTYLSQLILDYLTAHMLWLYERLLLTVPQMP